MFEMQPHTRQPHARQLGLAAATAVVVGESVALGIFLTPAAMARQLGSPLLLLAVWLAMAGMTVCGALCYAELAVRFPESGGDYVYLREGFGERIAFLFGWMSATVLDPGVAAAMAVGAAPYAAVLLPIGARGVAAFPVLVLLALAVINSLGTKLSGRFVALVNWLKMAVLFGLVGWTCVSGHAHAATIAPWAVRRAGSPPLFGAVVSAVVGAFFAFGGWWQAAKIAGEVKDYRRNLPRAFVGGVGLVCVLYIAVSFAFLAVIPLSNIAGDTTFIAQFGAALFGPAGSRILSACVLLAVAGGLSALTMASPRVYAAMAQNGQFFPVFGRYSRRFGTPVYAIALQTVVAIATVWLGAFDSILSYLIFACVVFLALTAGVLFRLPAQRISLEGQRPEGNDSEGHDFSRAARAAQSDGALASEGDFRRKWWYPVAPIVFIAASLLVGLLILLHDPLPALLGAAIVLAGDPLRRWLLPKPAAS
jgi:APA family basic amino acid/polyamine antiporter